MKTDATSVLLWDWVQRRRHGYLIWGTQQVTRPVDVSLYSDMRLKVIILLVIPNVGERRNGSGSDNKM